jgi:hypothetical protein
MRRLGVRQRVLEFKRWRMPATLTVRLLRHRPCAGRSPQFHTAAAQHDWTAGYDTADQAQVRCRTCGATTDAGRFCSSCGSALADDAQCRGCGNRLGYDAMFCSRCGQAR